MTDIQQILDLTEGLGVIYKLTSPSGKSYIGQSVVFSERYSTYKRRKKNAIGRKLYNALNKYNGIENFEIQIVCTVTLIDDLLLLKEQLSELEIFYIELFDTFKTGYNSTLGGEGSLGRETTQETKDKIGKANTGKRAVENIKCICAVCKQEFELTPSNYRLRIKRNSSIDLYCSIKCSGEFKRRKVENLIVPCATCGKEMIMQPWEYRKRIKKSVCKILYCSTKCGTQKKNSEVEQRPARQTHNLEVIGSNPIFATTLNN
jgi:group I intron endonuclease